MGIISNIDNSPDRGLYDYRSAADVQFRESLR